MFGFGGGIVAYRLADNNKMVKIEPKEEQKREAPKNISGISDPMENYSRYKDDVSHLYRPIKREVVNRIEIGDDEDSK